MRRITLFLIVLVLAFVFGCAPGNRKIENTGSDYFESSGHKVTPGARARSSDINSVVDALDTGLDKLPSESDIKRGKINYAVDTGSANAYVVSLPYPPTSYEDGMKVVFKASSANTTGSCNINVNSLGVKAITRQDGTSPIAGDIAANKFSTLRYNSTSGKFEIQGSVGATAGTGTMSLQNASSVNITGGAISGVSVNGSLLTASGSDLNASIAGDNTPGRVFRMARLTIEDGTNPDTIKCAMYPHFNSAQIGPVDNIDFGYIGGFDYDASASIEIDKIMFPGECVAILGVIDTETTTGTLLVKPYADNGDIRFDFYDTSTGAPADLDTLVDSGWIGVHFFYLTSE